MPAYPHEVARGRARRASSSTGSPYPRPLPRRRPPRGGRVRRACSSASPTPSGRRGRSRSPAPSSCSGRHRREGDRPAARVPSSSPGSTGSSSTRTIASTGDRPTRPEVSSLQATPCNGGATRRRGRARGEDRRARRRRVPRRGGHERDPLARARRAGRQDRRRSSTPPRCCTTGKSVQAFPEYGPGAARRAAPRVHAHRRQADPPTRLDQASRTSSSSSSRRSLTSLDVTEGLRAGRASCSSTPTSRQLAGLASAASRPIGSPPVEAS